MKLMEKKEDLSELIAKIVTLLQSEYVFPDIADEIALVLVRKLDENDYDKIANETELAKALTNDIRSVNPDKHLLVTPHF